MFQLRTGPSEAKHVGKNRKIDTSKKWLDREDGCVPSVLLLHECLEIAVLAVSCV